MSSSQRSAWEGFLPPGAIVMGRKTEVSEPTNESTRAFEVIFVGQGIDVPEVRQLLDRMIEAMGLKPGQFDVRSSSDDLNDDLKQSGLNARVVVVLGRTALGMRDRGIFHDLQGTRVRFTHHPADMLSQPALKREVWQDLQEVSRALGVELPARKTGGPAR
jgi:hypothetical protein